MKVPKGSSIEKIDSIERPRDDTDRDLGLRPTQNMRTVRILT
jgi:hypothetical protein